MRPLAWCRAMSLMRMVIQAKSFSVMPSWPMSSARWPSKPALMNTISGRNASSRGIHIMSTSSRMSMPRV